MQPEPDFDRQFCCLIKALFIAPDCRARQLETILRRFYDGDIPAAAERVRPEGGESA